jgi:hypothetical protein
VAEIEIASEKESGGGWAFEARVIDAAGASHRFQVTLSWADYDHWSPGGGVEPARVAEAVIRFLLDRMPAGELRSKLDASLARRLFADADETIPRVIGKS